MLGGFEDVKGNLAVEFHPAFSLLNFRFAAANKGASGITAAIDGASCLKKIPSTKVDAETPRKSAKACPGAATRAALPRRRFGADFPVGIQPKHQNCEAAGMPRAGLIMSD